MDRLQAALAGGAVGACTLTLLHESVRRAVPDAPRLDVLGIRAIARSLRAAGREPMTRESLHKMALAGDLVANSLYYSLVGAGDRREALLCGSLLGLAAGVGALTLAPPLGLGSAPVNRTPATKVMTVAWYVAGGLAAAAAFRLFTRRA